ncbi:hypothetical protein RRG08_002355 [Elysia crispata]|uniref:Uncharacterized protein n=1 Tax=Elysia crispata TaxID=231223 RepID=A0AAE0ZUF0_9GAST|nr:hypothetical protein RRG08_002355 [Elysia crispata]
MWFNQLDKRFSMFDNTLSFHSERRNFHVKRPDESSTPGFQDGLLLLEKLMLVADNRNNSVRLFNEQGDYLQILKLSSPPYRLALIESGPGNTWKVAVTLPWDQAIAILEVTPDSVTQLAITAVDSATLAVGYDGGSGIDLIDMTGRVMRRLSKMLNPDYMTVTQDGCLFMCTMNNLTKVKIRDGKIMFHNAVPEIERPAGVATLQDGWFVVSDWRTDSLHLVTSDGRWDRELWRHPHCRGRLWGVSIHMPSVEILWYFRNAQLCM